MSCFALIVGGGMLAGEDIKNEFHKFSEHRFLEKSTRAIQKQLLQQFTHSGKISLNLKETLTVQYVLYG